MNQSLKLILRSIANRPILSFITFSGFTIGILAALLIYLWVFDELNHDKFHPDYHRIYRVLTLSKQGDKIVKSARSYRAIAKSIKADYPQIEAAAYVSYSSEDSPLYREDNNVKIEARGCFVSDGFFEVFKGFTFMEGNQESVYKNPSNIILSEKVARKLFGNKPALGKQLISDKFDRKIYTVSAVLHIPLNSHLDFGYLTSERSDRFNNSARAQWSDSYWVRTYIKLAPNSQIDEQFLSRVSNHISRYSNRSDKLMFQPLADIHLHSEYETGALDKHISSYKYVWIFSGLALLIVLMVVFNFSVLSIARSSEQALEIGIQKVNGAKRKHLIFQFMGNSFLQTFAAALLALLLSWLLLPWFNNLIGQELQFHLSLKLVINLIAITTLTAVLGGIYPSLYLSRLQPIRILQKKKTNGSKAGFLSFLVVIQFSIAIFTLIASGILAKQLNYIQSKDMGLNHKNILVVPTGLWYSSKSFKQELLKNPNVISASASAYAPIDGGFPVCYTLNHKGVIDSVNASLLWVDEDFANNYQLEIVKGQFLQMNYDSYWKETNKKSKNGKKEKSHTFSFPIVINQTAEKMFGFEDPIGQRIGSNIIVGVVKDFHFKSMHHQISPLVLANSPENIMTMNVKITPHKRAETIAYVRDIYKKHRGQREFSYQFFDDILNAEYQQENRLKNITTIFSTLTLLIALLGVLGMSWFSIRQRTKEIGVRKVNGAKTYEIITMLNKDFLKWVAVAFILACPIAWYAMNKWLENFAYRTELSWWIFALAGLIALSIALLTVSLQSWRAATRNPVESLRYE